MLDALQGFSGGSVSFGIAKLVFGVNGLANCQCLNT